MNTKGKWSSVYCSVYVHWQLVITTRLGVIKAQKCPSFQLWDVDKCGVYINLARSLLPGKLLGPCVNAGLLPFPSCFTIIHWHVWDLGVLIFTGAPVSHVCFLIDAELCVALKNLFSLKAASRCLKKSISIQKGAEGEVFVNIHLFPRCN